MAGIGLTKGRATLVRMLAILLVAAVLACPALPSRLPAVAAVQGDEDEDEDVHESELYGYTLSYDPAEWEVYQEDDDPDDEYDRIFFRNASQLSLVGLTGDPDYDRDQMPDCVEDYVAGLEDGERTSAVEPLDEPDAEGEDDDRAWA